MVAILMRRMDYREVHAFPTRRQGVDIVAADPVGKRTVAQVVHSTGPVAALSIQQLSDARTQYRADRAILMAPGAFTPSAEALAAQLGVELWDGVTFLGYVHHFRGQAKARTSS